MQDLENNNKIFHNNKNNFNYCLETNIGILEMKLDIENNNGIIYFRE